MAELAARHQLAVPQISGWKLHLRQQATQVLAEAVAAPPAPINVEPLYAATGRLRMENQLLKNASRMRVTQQRVLAQASAQGTVHARCQALSLGRSSYYYKPRGETSWNLTLMHLLDEEFTRHNFKGVRGLRNHLRTGLQDKREARAPPRAPHRPGAGLS